jgi:hypothetical protein
VREIGIAPIAKLFALKLIWPKESQLIQCGASEWGGKIKGGSRCVSFSIDGSYAGCRHLVDSEAGHMSCGR